MRRGFLVLLVGLGVLVLGVLSFSARSSQETTPETSPNDETVRPWALYAPVGEWGGEHG